MAISRKPVKQKAKNKYEVKSGNLRITILAKKQKDAVKKAVLVHAGKLGEIAECSLVSNPDDDNTWYFSTISLCKELGIWGGKEE